MSDQAMVVQAPHDGFFKKVFGNPMQAGGLLRALVPEVGDRLDWSTLVLAPTNFVTSSLRQRHGDLVFHARLTGGEDVLVSFLIEHQSTENRWMAHRIAELEVAMWSQWRLSNENAPKVPVIIPVVVYHGVRPWRAPTDTSELCAVPEGGAFDEHVMRCRFKLDDLTVLTDEALRARRLDALGTLSLVALTHARLKYFPSLLATCWVSEIRNLLRDGPSEGAVILFEYAMQVNLRNDPKTLVRALAPVAGDDAEAAIMTAGARLIQQGFEQGFAKGEVKGLAEGEVKGQRMLVQRLLEQRFGPLSSRDAARVDAAGREELERWALRVLQVERLELVFVE